MKCLIFMFFVGIACSWAKEQFNNYKVYRLIPQTDEELLMLKLLEKKNMDLDFWVHPRGKNISVDVMIPSDKLTFLKEFLKHTRIENTVLIEDVQKLIQQNTKRKRSITEFGWMQYHTLTEIYAWLKELVLKYPYQVSLLNIGKSYEGRNILGVKISFKRGNKAVFLEAGIHAREWIGPASVTYMLYAILTSEDPVIRDIAMSYDWYFLPVANPDGYEYTFTTNRNWRKSLQPVNDFCKGIDLNRNFNFHWMGDVERTWPCAADFAGYSPFSAPESLALAKSLSQLSGDLIAYFSFHSYSQLLLIPYGYSTKHLDNYNELLEIGTKAVQALEIPYGTKYQIGSVTELLYVASGGSTDWVKGKFRTPITYTYELRDTGKYGFLLPPDQIISTSEETLSSLITIMIEARARGYS